MHKELKYLLSSIFLVSLVGCNFNKSAKKGATYFGGEIINPKSKYVLFLKDDKILDTLYLKTNNRFITKFKNLNEGLYTFKHGGEFQYIYLQQTDSVLVRLNTWDFDESLVFSGKGSSKNEFLINLFLQNEKDDKAMSRFFKFKSKEFQNKIDSLAKKREANFKVFLALEKGKINDDYKKLINTAIYFPLYSLKEIYPYYNKIATNSNQFPSINPDFYKFRDHVNLNEKALVSFYPYQNYVVSYLYNLSYEDLNHSTKNLTVNLLNEINNHIKLEKFKNTLLKRVVLNDFLKSETTCSINQNTLAIFLKYCSNSAYKNQITNLVNDSKYVKNNELLHDFKVKTYDNEQKTIKKIIKGKNAVIYFWSLEFMSADYLVGRIQYLKNKYPNVLFIGIQLQPQNLNVKTNPKLKLLDLDHQFKLMKNSYASHYLTSNYPRTIIVTKSGKVVNGFTYLGSKYLTSQLNKLALN